MVEFSNCLHCCESFEGSCCFTKCGRTSERRPVHLQVDLSFIDDRTVGNFHLLAGGLGSFQLTAGSKMNSIEVDSGFGNTVFSIRFQTFAELDQTNLTLELCHRSQRCLNCVFHPISASNIDRFEVTQVVGIAFLQLSKLSQVQIATLSSQFSVTYFQRLTP